MPLFTPLPEKVVVQTEVVEYQADVRVKSTTKDTLAHY